MAKEEISLNKNEIDNFSMVLNKIMPKKFPWWKKVKIERAYILIGNVYNELIIISTLQVDRDWGMRSFYEYHYSSIYDDDNENRVTLGDIIGESTGKEIRSEILTLFKSFYPGEDVLRVSFSVNAKIQFVETKSNL